MSRLVLVVGACLASAVSCGGSESAKSITAPSVALSAQSLQVRPEGVGVQYGTSFEMTAMGTFPPGTQFMWQFGDGSSTTTTQDRATHVYRDTGTFTVTVQASAGSSSAATTARVSVGSLVGQWSGVVSGHTRLPVQRPVPVHSFQLRVDRVPVPVPREGHVQIRAFWSDDAGCRWDSIPGDGATPILQFFGPTATREVSFSLEHFECADGDMSFTGSANAGFTIVEGVCSEGPNCRFRMERR